MRITEYQHLETLLKHSLGELFDGRLYAQPRPAAPHGYTHSAVGSKLFNPFHDGIGGLEVGEWLEVGRYIGMDQADHTTLRCGAF